MKYKLSDINISQEGKIQVPDILHFVWIGEAHELKTTYIGIWSKTNKDKNIHFWCDEYTSGCNYFHLCIKEYISNNHFEDKINAEILIKNKAYKFMLPRLMKGETFNDLAFEFLTHHNIPHHERFRSELSTWHIIKRVVLKNINDLFSREYLIFKKYYYYEVILRGNLASASDIVRLLILYQYGGVYIDVDTLPYTDDLFIRLNQFTKDIDILLSDNLSIYKTKCMLKKLSLFSFDEKEYMDYRVNKFGVSKNNHNTILELVKWDIEEFDLQKVTPLGKLYVHKNLIAISSLKRLKGLYFNNLMFSHSKSKTVKIILRTMNKRYKFLEKHGCIFNFPKNIKTNVYLSRILKWRTELMTKEYCVTSVLTGPGLILEVLLGLAYELLDIDHSTEPSTIAELMQDEKLGIAFFQHNLDTPESLDSSWRKFYE